MAASRSAEAAGVKVIVRFRPVNDRERTEDGGQKSAVRCSDDGQILISQSADEMPKRYKFDHVFYDQTSQEEVYASAARATIEDVKAGYNGTLFAYGQTGSGKTFSMFGPRIGDPSLRGIIPRACMDILDMVTTDKKNVWEVYVSYLELYNERINDLINTAGKDLKVMERTSGGAKEVYVRDLHEERVSTINEVYELIVKGEMARAQAATKMNQESSRSHCVFMLKLRKMDPNDVGRVEREGRLYMVDLAGSEKLSKTGATGAAAHEAKSINQSLSTLGRCIKVIGDIQAFKRKEEEREREAMARGVKFKPSRKKMPQVPFRDSQLTRILQDSLVGNTKTTLVVACSPAKYNLLETISTLEFAKRAKMLVNVVKINRQFTRDQLLAMVEALKKEVQSLTLRNAALLKKVAWYKDNANVHPSADPDDPDGDGDDDGGPSTRDDDGDDDDDDDDGGADPAALAALKLELVEVRAAADAELSAVAAELDVTMGELEAAHEEAADLHVMVGELEEELERVHAQQAEEEAAAEAAAAAAAFDREQLEAQLAEAAAAAEAAAEAQAELVAALEEKDEDMADMAELTDATEAELEKVQTKLAEVLADARENAQAEAAVASLQAQLAEAEAALAEREAELVAALEASDEAGSGGSGSGEKASAERVAELEDALAEAKSAAAAAAEEAHGEMEEVLAHAEEAERERDHLAERVAALEAQLEGKISAEMSPEEAGVARAESLAAKLAATEATLEELKASMGAAVEEARADATAARVELAKAKTEIDELTSTGGGGGASSSRVLKLATKRNEELNAQVAQLKKAAAATAADVAAIEAVAPLAEAAAAVARAVENEAAVVQLKLKLQRGVAEKNKVEHELVVARQLAAAAEAKAAAAAGVDSRHEARLADVNAELGAVRGELRTTAEALTNARADIVIRDARIAELEDRLGQALAAARAGKGAAIASSSSAPATPASAVHDRVRRTAASMSPGSPSWDSRSRGSIDFGMDGALDFRVIRQRLAKTESEHLKRAQEEAARADAAFNERMGEAMVGLEEDVAANMGFSW